MQPAEGTYLEVKGRVPFAIDLNQLDIPEEIPLLSADEIKADIAADPLKIVAATIGEDEHSVGMREIIDIKHGGLEGFGVQCFYLGTSVAVQKVVDAAIEVDADAILVSTIITHGDIHRINMRRLHELCVGACGIASCSSAAALRSRTISLWVWPGCRLWARHASIVWPASWFASAGKSARVNRPTR